MIDKIIQNQDGDFFILVDGDKNYYVNDLYKDFLREIYRGRNNLLFRGAFGELPERIEFIHEVEGINLALLKFGNKTKYLAWKGDLKFARKNYFYSMRESRKGALNYVRNRLVSTVMNKLR